MATFRKRGRRWRAEVCKNGSRSSKSFGTKAEAVAWALELETGLANGANTGNRIVQDAFERYAVEVTPEKKGARWELIRLELLSRYALARVRLSDLSPEDLAIWRDQRLNEVSPASVNRELNLISSVFTVARREWRWLRENPVSDIRRPKRPKPRDRRIDEEETQRVLDALGFDGYNVSNKTHLVAVYFLIALETAMRLGEICALSDADIDLPGRFVVIRDSKNHDSRHVPLSLRAVDLFRLVMGSSVTVESGVASTLFRKACRNAEIVDLRFHDSRHEALTRLARKLDVLDLARMVGHREPKSLMIYYNATATEIAARLDD